MDAVRLGSFLVIAMTLAAVLPIGAGEDGHVLGIGGPPIPRSVMAVDWGWDTISDPVMAIGPDSVPHIAYSRSNGFRAELVHATGSPGRWEREVVWSIEGEEIGINDIDMVVTDDATHIAFTFESWYMIGVFHAIDDGSGWELDEVERDAVLIGMEIVGNDIVLVIDEWTALTLETWNGTGWEVSAIEPDWSYENIARVSSWGGDLRVCCWERSTGSIHILSHDGNVWSEVNITPPGSDRLDTEFGIGFTMGHDGPTVLAGITNENGYGTEFMSREGSEGEWMPIDTTWVDIRKGVMSAHPNGEPMFIWYDQFAGFCVTPIGSIGDTNLSVLGCDAIDDPPRHSHWPRHYPVVGDYGFAHDPEGALHLFYVNVTSGKSVLEHTTRGCPGVENEPPTAKVLTDIASGPSRLAFNLTFVMDDPDGSIVAFRAYIDRPEHPATEGINHIRTPGKYTVHLFVWDDHLRRTDDTFEIVVGEPTLRVDIDPQRTRGPPGSNITFMASVSGQRGNVTEPVWIVFTNQGYMEYEGEEVHHIFEEPGEYRIFASVADSTGTEVSSSVIVRIAEPGPGVDREVYFQIVLLAVLSLAVLVGIVYWTYVLFLSREEVAV